MKYDEGLEMVPLYVIREGGTIFMPINYPLYI